MSSFVAEQQVPYVRNPAPFSTCRPISSFNPGVLPVSSRKRRGDAPRGCTIADWRFGMRRRDRPLTRVACFESFQFPARVALVD